MYRRGRGRQSGRLRTVGTDPSESVVFPGAFRLTRSIHVSGRRGILRVLVVVRHLPRVPAVGFGDPDLEMAGAIRTPQEGLAVAREARVLVLRRIVREASHPA